MLRIAGDLFIVQPAIRKEKELINDTTIAPLFFLFFWMLHKKIFMSIQEALKKRILVIDGAMGTMIQRHKLTEQDYRGTRFANWPSDLKGNNDLLCITQPAIITGIHLLKNSTAR